MSVSTQAMPWTVRLSARIYRWLLVAYPRTFRREYGAHMVQVFRDCCREAAAADGAAGFLRYWSMATSDLIMSALAERRQEEVFMSRGAFRIAR